MLQDPSNVDCKDWTPPLPLGALSKSDAAELLRFGLGRPWRDSAEQELASEVTGLLEGNPLCADLAGRLMRYGQIEIEQLGGPAG